MKYEILSEEGYPIKLPNGKLVYVEGRGWPIISEFPDVLILTMKINNDNPQNNFLGINEQGEVIWRFNEGNYLDVKHHFNKVQVDNEGNLWIKNLAGKEYKVDCKTGKVLETKFENIDFEYDGRSLKISSKKITMPSKIKKIDSWRGKLLIVMYGSSERLDEGERVAVFDYSGDQVWDKGEETFRINKLYGIGAGEDYLSVSISMYVHKVDYATGEIIETEYTK